MLAEFSFVEMEGADLFSAAWTAGYFASLTLLFLLVFALLSSLILPGRAVQAVKRARFGSWLAWCTVIGVSTAMTYVFVLLPYDVGFGWQDGVNELWKQVSRQT